MFRKSKQQRHEITPVVPSIERSDASQPDIERFVEDAATDLVGSARLWRTVSTGMRSFSSDERVVRAFHDGVPECISASGIAVNQIRAEREADRLVAHLGIYTQTAARYQSRQSAGIRDTVHASKLLLTEFPGEGVPYIFQNNSFPRREYLSHYTDMVDSMRQADVVSNRVLSELCDTYAVTPLHVQQLRDMYVDETEEAVPLLVELRAMISEDWHRLDPKRSVLRKHCERLSSDPALHIVPFCEAVARSETAGSVATMARYALMSSGVRDASSADVARQLYSTHQNWKDIPDLQEAFNDYVSGVEGAVTKAFESIAGPRTLKNPRLERTPAEVFEISASMTVHGVSNAADARVAKRAMQASGEVYRKNRGKGAASRRIDSTADVANRLDSSELLEPKGVSIVSYVNGKGYERESVDELTPELLTARFGLERDQRNLAEDMVRAVEYLRAPQLTIKGIARLKSVDGVRFDGSSHRLWRLAPDKTPGLKVDPGNRFYRIIYTLAGGEVVLHDIVSHAEFDKKYGG